MSKTSFNIGIIIGSQRSPRCGDQITAFVLSTIKSHLALHPSSRQLTFQTIDIAAVSLPLFDEPGVPSQIKSPSGYAHEHTRSWSRAISALDAFVFVTPQYNWGIPAGLKNAIDYLFHEWKGKPAMVVSYGGHGGDKCAAALKVVLGGGLGMRVVDETVNLAFPGREVLYKAAGGQDLGLDEGDGGMWAGERGNIIRVWEEMEKLL
ncbi:Nadph-dependent fmn reductase protein [Coniochaeta hoffmannii]|uniref:Nadph-dependent fmn reductase protein n=1 Tax=Coniochaeta hoffmannii TaxID=91930 RepID=A0AA38VWH2_9PEZI|nr:Nadph-dependent fmn reductase protein [Coniochaeta hoffmannii]